MSPPSTSSPSSRYEPRSHPDHQGCNYDTPPPPPTLNRSPSPSPFAHSAAARPHSSNPQPSSSHRNNHNNDPKTPPAPIPRTYADLSTSDILALVPLFIPIPINSDSNSNPDSTTPRPGTATSFSSAATATSSATIRLFEFLASSRGQFSQRESIERKRIETLPRHLRAKHPLLNTLCHSRPHSHAKLNPAPIASLLQATVLDVLGRVDHHLDEEEGAATLGLSREETRVLRGLDALMRRRRWRCKACQLLSVAEQGGLEALVLLGGCVVARVGHRKWGRSKRVRWMEEWVRAWSAGRSEAELEVERMWSVGMRVWEGKREVRRERVLRRQRRAEPPLRPSREAEQDDHVRIANAFQVRRHRPRTIWNPFADPTEGIGELFPAVEGAREVRRRARREPGAEHGGNRYAQDADQDAVTLFPAGPEDRTGFEGVDRVEVLVENRRESEDSQGRPPRSFLTRSRPAAASSLYSSRTDDGEYSDASSSIYSRAQDDEDENDELYSHRYSTTATEIIDMYL